MVINYFPNPSAVAVHKSQAYVKAVCGPVGCGKSSQAVLEFLLHCTRSTVPVTWVAIRSSYRELEDSTKKTFLHWLGDLTEMRESDNIAFVRLPGADGVVRTHEMKFRACRKAEEASKFLGTEPGGVWIDEPVPAFSSKGVMGAGVDKGVFDQALMRTRQADLPYHEIILTFNPPTTNNWVYDTFFLAKAEALTRKSYALFRVPPRENTTHLPVGYYDRLYEVLSPDLARRFLDGEVVTIYPGERVLPECKEQYHIQESLTPHPTMPLVLGFDFGLTPCCLITQITPTGQWLWLKELQLFNASIEDLLEELVPILNTEFPGLKWRSWGDSQALNKRSEVDARTPANVMKTRGFPCEPGVMDWFTRREVMKQRFSKSIQGEPAILVSRDGCPLTTEGVLGGYRYPKSMDGRIGDQPIKNEFSHLLDGAQCIATREFGILHGFKGDQEIANPKQPVWNPLASKPRRGLSRVAY